MYFGGGLKGSYVDPASSSLCATPVSEALTGGLRKPLPFIFQPVSDFDPAGLGRGVSLEYTLGRTTTFKVLGSYNEAVEIEAEDSTKGSAGGGAGGLKFASPAFTKFGLTEFVARMKRTSK